MQTAGRRKISRVLSEYKHGALHSGSKTGPLVTDRDQAVAIAMSEKRKADKTKPSRALSRPKGGY